MILSIIKTKRIHLFAIIILVFNVYSCDKKNTQEQVSDSILSDSLQVDFVDIAQQTYINIVHSTPSPTFISPILSDNNIPFYNDLALEFDNNMLKRNIQQQAFLQGLLSTDLSYLNNYKKSFMSLSYYNEVKLLASNIGIEKFYNTENFKKFVAFKNNSDSLLAFTLTDFIQVMEFNEKKSDPHNITLNILFGAWLESLYLISEIEKRNSLKDLKKLVLLQNINAQRLLELYKICPSTYFNVLIMKELVKINDAFNQLPYSIKFKEIEVKNIDHEFYTFEKFDVTLHNDNLELKELQQQIKSSREKLLRKF